MEIIEKDNNITIINDCYNASVDSMKSGLQMLNSYKNSRKIAILGPDPHDNSVGSLRLAGYKRALTSNGIDFNDKLIIPMDHDTADYTMENGYAAMSNFLKEGIKISAVFAISDTLALGAARAIYDAGLRIPEDIAVAGFDGIPACKYYVPSITTIRQPLYDMAKESARILFDVIDKKGEHMHEVFPGELIIGESTEV
jgi:LacI family transcriptional regulator